MGDWANNGDWAANGDWAGVGGNPIKVHGEIEQLSEALVVLRSLVRVHGEGLNLSEQDLHILPGVDLVKVIAESMSLSEADLHVLIQALTKVEGEVSEQAESVLHFVEAAPAATGFIGWGIPL